MQLFKDYQERRVRLTDERLAHMDATTMKLWYDPETDFLEVIFDSGIGVAEDTADERVEVRVDKQGRVLSFHILGLKSTAHACQIV